MRVEAILAALDEADHEARGTGELRGLLCVGTPVHLGLMEIIPRLPAFIEQHPRLKIELWVTGRYADFVIEGLDVSLQFGAQCTLRRCNSIKPDVRRNHRVPFQG